MSKELERLKKEPPHGITCWPRDGMLNHLEANLLGREGTPYEGGVFKLEITIPNRYPFEPPDVQFLTKIYHPNIDTAGRICLDVLKSPPTGSWKPAHNIHTILTSIQLLLAEPNPDDGLMAEISSEYKHQRPTFIEKAKEWTRRFAKMSVPTGAVDDGSVVVPSGESSVHIDRQNSGDTVEQEGKGKETSDGQGDDDDDVLIIEGEANDDRGTKRKWSDSDDQEELEANKRKHSIEK